MVDSGKALMGKVLSEKGRRGGGGLKMSAAELLQNDFTRAVQFNDTERVREYGYASGDAARLMGEVAGLWNDLHRGVKW
jgi:hypothetical protein